MLVSLLQLVIVVLWLVLFWAFFPFVLELFISGDIKSWEMYMFFPSLVRSEKYTFLLNLPLNTYVHFP